MKNSEEKTADTIYFLGIDGGGTKTAFVLQDDNGNVVGMVTLECCNPIDIGIEKAQKVLREGILQVKGDISLNQIIMYAGIAGGASGNMKQQLKDFFDTIGFRAFENDSDNKNIVSAGLGKENGITLIMGTGSCAIAQINGTQKRISGWGYLFDDGGSAYNIGRDGLAAHFRYLDGTGAYTLFSDMMKEEYEEEQQLIRIAYEKGKSFIASFARKVFECAEKGDEVALGIIRRNMEVAAHIIETAAKDIEEETVKVVLAGGLTSNQMAVDFLKESLSKERNYQIQVLNVPPVEGALMLAKKLWQKTGGN